MVVEVLFSFVWLGVALSPIFVSFFFFLSNKEYYLIYEKEEEEAS